MLKEYFYYVPPSPVAMHSNLKILGAIFFPSGLRANQLQPMTAEEICTVLALFMLMSIEQKSEIVFPTTPAGSHAHFCFCYFFGQFESICRFLHFIDNTSKDTSEGPQNY
jgi:hypothetical protein